MKHNSDSELICEKGVFCVNISQATKANAYISVLRDDVATFPALADEEAKEVDEEVDEEEVAAGGEEYKLNGLKSISGAQ